MATLGYLLLNRCEFLSVVILRLQTRGIEEVRGIVERQEKYPWYRRVSL